MVFITSEVFAENCIYTIKQQKKDNTSVLWINDSVDKEIKDKCKDKPTEKQMKIYKKHGSEFIKGLCFAYAHEDVVIPIIMGGRSPEAIEFRSRLGFTQYDITLKKESSGLKSIMEHYEGEDMETQYQVLNYRIDFFFREYKLAIEIDEKGHKDRNKDYEKQREVLIKRAELCIHQNYS